MVALLAQGPPPRRVYLPVIHRPPSGRPLLAAAHIDSALSGEADEAILLWHRGDGAAVDLAGWTLEANGRRATFPPGLVLAPGARLWCAAQAAAFRLTFGVTPACEWAADSDPAVPNLTGSVLRLTNSGGVITLRDPAGQVLDTLLYGDEIGPAPGWQGAPAALYTRGVIAAQGQVWQRKRDPRTGLPLDSDQATDWAGDLADVAWGRRVRFPGWDGWDDYDGGLPVALAVDATITVAVAPEGLYASIADAIHQAAHTLDLSLYTLEHPQLAQAIAAAAGRGVRVRLLLEGAPPGGISDLQRWCVRLIAQAGGDVRYLARQDDAPAGLQPRYRYTHAKSGVVDGRLALVGTENFSQSAMPVPEAAPSGGRRGAYLLVDAPAVAATLAARFARDWAPDRFGDLQPYVAGHARYGDPPAGYTLPPPPVYAVPGAPFAAAVTATGLTRVVLLHAPEHALRPDAGLFALLAQADAGDTLYLAQLYEHKFWGDGDSNPVADPNPRLEALIAAARRGATVRVLLDDYFDDPSERRSNAATAAYLNALAAAEGLDLQARVGNPTGGGLHAKWLLAEIDGITWSAVGSLNGGEVSHKLNREVVLLVDAPAVYARLAEVFVWDWGRSN